MDLAYLQIASDKSLVICEVKNSLRIKSSQYRRIYKSAGFLASVFNLSVQIRFLCEKTRTEFF